MLQMKQQHTNAGNLYPQQHISIVALTWNLHGSIPPINSTIELYRSTSFSPPPDLIIIGTQECQRSLLMTFCCEAKTEWQAQLSEVFTGYYLAAAQVMRGIHTALLLKHRLKDYFSIENRSKLRAGSCGMGNKGALSLQMSLLGQMFQVINCHLAPHQTASNLRNQTIKRIAEQIQIKDPSYEVIFLGDLNYRIDMTKDEYQLLAVRQKPNTNQQMNYSAMLNRDQLYSQQELKRTFLNRYEEGTISFPPTYKMSLKNNEYRRERIPGWTDRIFKRKFMGGMELESYLCGYNILGCDHRPVIAKFKKIIKGSSASFNPRAREIDRGNQQKCQII